MDRAKKKTETVKNSTETVKGKVDNFRLIPGFSKYEFNGVICRNAKTKSIMSLKLKNNKYQLISDEGKNVDKSKEQLVELVGVKEQPKKPVVKKEAMKKKTSEKKPFIPIDIKNAKKEYVDVVNMDSSKKEKIVRLHLSGATNKEIQALLGTNQGWIWNEINNYKKDPNKFKI